MDGWIGKKQMVEWIKNIDEWLDVQKQIDGWVDRRKDKIDGWLDGQKKNRWMIGWMDGQEKIDG